MFPKSVKEMQNNIMKAIESKLITINYIICYNLLPFTNDACRLCKMEIESTGHLLFEWYKTVSARQTPYNYLTAAGKIDQSKRNIKETYEISNLLQIQILGYYKHAIGLYRNIAALRKNKQ